MDPQTTWKQLIEAWSSCDWQRAVELAEALMDWLLKEGFPPETMGALRLGADLNHEIATATCRFVQKRAQDVLRSPNGIPPEVAFTLSCDTCNNEGPDGYDQAIAEGWKYLRYTPAGASENILGCCPFCQAADGR